MIGYQEWRSGAQKKLKEQSVLAQTSLGPVEYGENGSGPVLMAIHGSPGGYDQGMLIAGSIFSGAGFRLIAPSRPGYLRTPLKTGATPEEQADSYAALLDSLHIEKAALLGISGGGASALQFALRHGDRLSCLVLLSAASRRTAYDLSMVEKIFMHDFPLWLASLMPEMAAGATMTYLEPYATGVMDPEKIMIVQSFLDTMVPPSMRSEGTRNDVDQYARLTVYPLERITAPTLIVHGTDDKEVPIEDAYFAASSIAQARTFFVEKGGHMLIVNDQSEAVKSTICAFVSSFATAE